MSKRNSPKGGKTFEPSFTKIKFGSGLYEQASAILYSATEIARKDSCPTNEEYKTAMDYFGEGLANYRILLDIIKSGEGSDQLFEEYSNYLRVALAFAAKVKKQCDAIHSKLSDSQLKKALEEIDNTIKKSIPTEETNDKPPFIFNDNDKEAFEISFRRRVYDRTFFGACEFPDFSTYSGSEGYKKVFDEQIILPIQFSSVALSETSVNGVFLYGPPGTGKTSLVRTVAGELAKQGMPAILIVLSGSDLKGPYVSNIDTAIRILFEEAKKYTNNGKRPVLIFIDEADSIFSGSSQGGNEQNNSAISEYKAQTDPVESNKNILSKIHVFIATNYPEKISPDVLSRFEKKIYVPDPTFNETRSTILINLKEKIGGWENINFATEGDASIQAQRIDMNRKEFIWSNVNKKLWQPYPHQLQATNIPFFRVKTKTQIKNQYIEKKVGIDKIPATEWFSVSNNINAINIKDPNILSLLNPTKTMSEVLMKKTYQPLYSDIHNSGPNILFDQIADFSWEDHLFSDAELFINYALGDGYSVVSFMRKIYDKVKLKKDPIRLKGFGERDEIDPTTNETIKVNEVNFKSDAHQPFSFEEANTKSPLLYFLLDSGDITSIVEFIEDANISDAKRETILKTIYEDKILPFFETIIQVFMTLMTKKTGLSQIFVSEFFLRFLMSKDETKKIYSDLILALGNDEMKVLQSLEKILPILEKTLSVKESTNTFFMNSYQFYLLQIYKAMYARFDVVDILTLKAQKEGFVQRNIGRWIKIANRNGAADMKTFLTTNIDSTGTDYKKWLYVKNQITARKTIYADMKCIIKTSSVLKWIPLEKSYKVDIDERVLKEKMSTRKNFDPYYDMIENFFISGRMKENQTNTDIEANKLNYEIGKMWGFKYDTMSDKTFVELKIFNDQENFTKDVYGKLIVSCAMEIPTTSNGKEYNKNKNDSTNTGPKLVSKTVRHYELPSKLRDVKDFDTTFYPRQISAFGTPHPDFTKKRNEAYELNITGESQNLVAYIKGALTEQPKFRPHIFEFNVALLNGQKFPNQRERLPNATLVALFSSYKFRISILDDTESLEMIPGSTFDEEDDDFKTKMQSVLYDGVSFLNSWYLMQFATKKYDNPIPTEKIDDPSFLKGVASSQLTLPKLDRAIKEVRQERVINYKEMLEFAGGVDDIAKDIYLAETDLIISKMLIKIEQLSVSKK